MQRSDGRILATYTGSLPRPGAPTKLYALRPHEQPVDAADRNPLATLKKRRRGG